MSHPVGTQEHSYPEDSVSHYPKKKKKAGMGDSLIKRAHSLRKMISTPSGSSFEKALKMKRA